MADVHFDLSFDGTLAPGAEPLAVRQQLAAIFKLDEPGVARLFTGKPVFIKREVDVATAAKFERVFNQAGAILRITPSDAASQQGASHSAPSPAPTASDPDEPESPPSGPALASSGLAIAPQGGFLEDPTPVKMPDLDTSYLSLVSSPDWSLEDCEPIVATRAVGDLSHLSLVDLDRPNSQDSSD